MSKLSLVVSICLNVVSIKTLNLDTTKTLSQKGLNSLDYPSILIFVEISTETLNLDT
jgi:hypothetical protein